eukprot:scaffold6919_cov92-Isochrysis_galbana.AAC.1
MSEVGGSGGASTVQDPVGRDLSRVASGDPSRDTSRDPSRDPSAGAGPFLATPRDTAQDTSLPEEAALGLTDGKSPDLTGVKCRGVSLGEARALTGGEEFLPGFPLSDVLQPLGFGEAALGLAAQALARWAPEHSPPEEMERRLRAYFYR